MKKILFLVPYPVGQAPSQRFRFEQYIQILHSAGFSITMASFWSVQGWTILYKQGHSVRKFIYFLSGCIKRTGHLLMAWRFDYIFLHREALPLGPPIIEWTLTKLLRKKVIYDFDDAIWLENTSSQNRIAMSLKWHSKVKSICKWSWKISVGNGFLADFARQYNPQVVINPTTIDTHYHVPASHQNDKITIGWTGTHSTAKYLDLITNALNQLKQSFDFNVLIISNQDPDWDFDEFEFVPWAADNEIETLQRLDIGLMPLEDHIWELGKCGFKALQYMALEIPAVVSAVGVNKEIIEHGRNGFLCSDKTQWIESLTKLLSSEPLRKEIGKAGRQRVIENYSVSSNADGFLSLFT